MAQHGRGAPAPRDGSGHVASGGADADAQVPSDVLADSLVRLARELEHETGSEATLAHVVRGAVALIPGVDEASVSVVAQRRTVDSLAPTGELAARVDALQGEVGQGPCLDAVWEQQTVRVPDLAHERRWPLFARRAAEAGAGSMLSFQLFVRADNLGALNLYSRRPQAFDDESEHVGLLFAAHAAVAFAGARKEEQLVRALGNRDVIGQAKGILMERYKITGDRAFALLVRVSQDTNRKLREVADELVQRGDLRSLHPDGADVARGPAPR